MVCCLYTYVFIGIGIDGSYWPWDCVRGFLGLLCGGVIGGALWRRRGRGMRLFRVLCCVVLGMGWGICLKMELGHLLDFGSLFIWGHC